MSTIQEKFARNVTWQQIGVILSILTFSATLAIGMLATKVDKIDAKVDSTIEKNNDSLVSIVKATAPIEDMKAKVDEMYKSYIKQGIISSEVIVNNHQ